MTAQRKNAFTSRRSMLCWAATGICTTVMAGNIVQGQTQTTPTATEGPFWEDEKLLRSNIVDSQAGLPLQLTVSVSQLVGTVVRPLPNAYVDIWHCNAYGYYSDEPAGMGNPNTLGQTYLRGYQITNSRGLAQFTSIYPGWYSSRTAHVHARVRTYNGTTVTRNITTQFFFDDAITDQVYSRVTPYSTRSARDTRNTTDSVFNTTSGGTAIGNRLLLRLGTNGIGRALASFNIVVA